MSRYRIVPERSKIHAEARSSLHPIRAETTGLEGWLEVTVTNGQLDVGKPVAGAVELDVELLRTGNGLYDRELERRLEARRYPFIRGRVKGLGKGAVPDVYHVAGELTFHGVTRDVDGDVAIHVRDDGRTLLIEGEREFDIRDYGLEPPKLFILRVYPEVAVRGEVVAVPEGDGGA